MKNVRHKQVTLASLIDQLANVRLFSGMSRDLVADALKRITEGVRRFSKGEVVVYEGTKAKWVVVVLSGRLTVYESVANGVRHSVRVLTNGHLFGATMVTANLEYYPGMAFATVSSEVLFLNIAKLKEIWREAKYAKLFENLYTIVSGEVLNCWRKVSILSCKKVEDRIMLYLRWYASEVGESNFVLPFATSEALAQYLCVTRTALSLAINRLVKRGEIAHPGRGRFVLLGLI